MTTVIREHVSAAYGRLGAHIREITGIDGDELNEFLSHGMWLNVQAALADHGPRGRLRLDPEAPRDRFGSRLAGSGAQ